MSLRGLRSNLLNALYWDCFVVSLLAMTCSPENLCPPHDSMVGLTVKDPLKS